MQSPRPRASKEVLFARVAAPDDTVAFHNVTSYIGKPMPFNAPQAVCAMRASASIVAFSLLHPTKKAAKATAEKPLEIPRGALQRLERRGTALNTDKEIGADDLVIELTGGTPAAPEISVYRLKLERDENGVLSLESEGEDDTFVLPKQALRISLYMRSPVVGRLLAVGFVGHLGKPESTETVRRAAAMVLFSATQLTEFSVLSGVETVTVPANSARYAPRPTRAPSEKAVATIPVYLFTGGDAPASVAYGTVKVEVDLMSANPTSNRLLFHYTPSAEIADHFEEYRAVVDSTISAHVRDVLGNDDVANITYDIILGDVSSGTVGRLREALEEASAGFNFTPTQFAVHGA